MEKIDLKNVTLVCIDGRNDLSDEDIKHHKLLAKHMLSVADYGSFKMFLSRDAIIEGATVNIIDPHYRGYVGYSRFCIQELHNHIDKDYVLLYHSDSFIVNPELWDPEFLKYDYIGAPWPLYLGWPKIGNQVGNGGFSLRTRRLHEFIKDFRYVSENEDTFIVGTHLHDLLGNGFKIAPLNLATKFSLENPVDENHTLDNVFGFHSKNYLEQAMKKINL